MSTLYDAVWFQPARKDDALAACKRLGDDELERRGLKFGLSFVMGGVFRAEGDKQRGYLVYTNVIGAHGLTGDDVCGLCDWTQIKANLWGGTWKPGVMESESWAARAEEQAQIEAKARADAAKARAVEMSEEYAHLLACTARYLQLCEAVGNRGIPFKDCKAIIGAQPQPDGLVIQRALARARAPEPVDPFAAAASAHSAIARSVRKKRA